MKQLFDIILKINQLDLNQDETEALIGLIKNTIVLNKQNFKNTLNEKDLLPWVETIKGKLPDILNFLDQVNLLEQQLSFINEQINFYFKILNKKEISGDDLIPLLINLVPNDYQEYKTLLNQIEKILTFIQLGSIAYHLTNLHSAITKKFESNPIETETNESINQSNFNIYKQIYFDLSKQDSFNSLKKIKRLNILCGKYINELIPTICIISKHHLKAIDFQIENQNYEISFFKLYEITAEYYQNNEKEIEKNIETKNIFTKFLTACDLYSTLNLFAKKNMDDFIDELNYKFHNHTLSPSNNFFATIQKKSNCLVHWVAPNYFSSKPIFNLSAEEEFFRFLRKVLPELVSLRRQQIEGSHSKKLI